MDSTGYSHWPVPPTPPSTSNARPQSPFQPTAEYSPSAITEEMDLSTHQAHSLATNILAPLDYRSSTLPSSSTLMELANYPVLASSHTQRPDISMTPGYAEPAYPSHTSLYAPNPNNTVVSPTALPPASREPLPVRFPSSLPFSSNLLSSHRPNPFFCDAKYPSHDSPPSSTSSTHPSFSVPSSSRAGAFAQAHPPPSPDRHLVRTRTGIILDPWRSVFERTDIMTASRHVYHVNAASGHQQNGLNLFWPGDRGQAWLRRWGQTLADQAHQGAQWLTRLAPDLITSYQISTYLASAWSWHARPLANSSSAVHHGSVGPH